MSSLDCRLLGVEKSLSHFQEIQDKCKDEIDELRAEVDYLNRKPMESSLMKVELLEEIEQREMRRDNIIIFGLPEVFGKSLGERHQHDVMSTQEMFQTVGLSNVQTVEVRRIGKIVNGKVRPLRVKLRDRVLQYEIINKSKDLRKSHRYKNVFISRDLTKEQQQEQYKLRQELKRQRDAGADVVIYNNEVRLRDSLRNFRQ